MKKIFFISCIAISALAVTTSANTNKHQNFYNQYALNDTVPNPTTDTMHNNMQNNQNNPQDTSMQPRTDTASTAPPRK